ncbi:MAG: hypothetical protein ACYC5O_10820 [Anaerolineae bacterium]
MSTLAVSGDALGGRRFGWLPKFDPTSGQTVVEPTGQGSGYWVGAPSIYYDTGDRLFYLYYRVREPRPVRGKECRIGVSSDGVHFDTVWVATQAQIGTGSMERSCLTRTDEGMWRLYLSYVHPSDSRWRIDMIEAEKVEALDVTRRRTILTADDTDSEGVKDPWVAMMGPLHYMLASFATKPASVPAGEQGQLHATGDIYNTGVSKSSTGLAISEDGVHWQWQGEVFAPSASGWDCWASRLGSLVYVPPVWVGFYDGAAGVAENYEERCGLAVTTDLRHFYRVSTSGPAITSPHGSGSVRYVDGVHARGAYWFYYEFTRADGAHELRVSRVAC